MKKTVSIAAAACVLGVTAPAHADWGQTRWGDSIDTVMAAVGDGIAGKAGEDDDRVFDQDLRAEREGDFHGIAARYQFYVDRSGGLSLVRATPKDEAGDCEAFGIAARSEFGEPHKHKTEDLYGTRLDRTEWADRKANLAILLSEFGAGLFVERSCLVIWQPYGSGNPGPDN